MPAEQPPATVLIIRDQADIWVDRKVALEKAGFQVVDAENHAAASRFILDSAVGIDLLITSPDFSVPQLQLAAETVEQHGLPVIVIAAGAAYPIGIQDKVAILLEPVSNAELISAARQLLSPRSPTPSLA